VPRRPGSQSSLRAPALPVVHLARDYPPSYTAARVREGAWIRVRPGAYVDASPDADRHTRGRTVALARIAALRDQLRAPYVLGHESAALLWGLPLLGNPDQTMMFAATKPTGRSVDVVRHVHRLPPAHTTIRLGHPVTTLERTVVDCAMTLGGRAGLMVADAALHAGVPRERCLEILESMAGHRGVVVARAILDLADDGAESPGESSARFVLLRAGLPVPQTQVRVDTYLGTFWSDLGWPEWRLLAEYDGRAKYEANGSASEAVIEEKRRQDAIEEADWRVLRITKEDVNAPDRLVRRVVRAAPAGAGGGLRPRAALVVPPSRSSF